MDKTEKLIDWKEDERKDRNRDGIDDDLEPDVPDVSAGSRKLAGRLRENTDTSPILSGGDIVAAPQPTSPARLDPILTRRAAARTAPFSPP